MNRRKCITSVHIEENKEKQKISQGKVKKQWKGREGKWERAVTRVHGPGFLSCPLWGPHQWPCFRARSSASHNQNMEYCKERGKGPICAATLTTSPEPVLQPRHKDRINTCGQFLLCTYCGFIVSVFPRWSKHRHTIFCSLFAVTLPFSPDAANPFLSHAVCTARHADTHQLASERGCQRWIFSPPLSLA